MVNKITANDILKMKADGTPIACLTAYDFPTAAVVDEAGADLILVGDSLAMVVQGREDTLAVTMDEMTYHVSMVARAARRAMVVADMPFMSFQQSDEAAVANAGRLVKEGGAQAVKLEGAAPDTLRRVERIVAAGIPVMGHIGYTPQSTHYFGRNIVQGKTERQARLLWEAARSLQKAGCFAVVLEMVPWQLAGLITNTLEIPTIGIGSGNACDGQVLVLHDLVGFYRGYSPKFVRRLADVSGVIANAVKQYCSLVRAREYPADAEATSLAPEVWDAIKDWR